VGRIEYRATGARSLACVASLERFLGCKTGLKAVWHTDREVYVTASSLGEAALRLMKNYYEKPERKSVD